MSDPFRNQVYEKAFGFKWGCVDVVRMGSDPKYGFLIELATPHQIIRVRVSPSGRVVEVEGPEKRDRVEAGE